MLPMMMPQAILAGLAHGCTVRVAPRASERAVNAAMALLAEAKTLRPGDRLTARLPIEGKDIPLDNPNAWGVSSCIAQNQ
jgi:hypothetical protein